VLFTPRLKLLAFGFFSRRAEIGGTLAVEVGLGIEAVVEEAQELLQQDAEVVPVAGLPRRAGCQGVEQGL